MTTPATDQQCFELQAHAIATDDPFLRRLAYAALGYETRVAMMPLDAREIEVARIGVADQLEMLALQGVILRRIP
jgi:hypothetical protein